VTEEQTPERLDAERGIAQPSAPEPSAPALRIPRWVLAVAIVPLLVVAALVAVASILPGWLLARVVAEARNHDIELTECALEYRLEGLSINQISLSGCKFTAQKPVTITGSIQRVVVDLAGQTPTGLKVESPTARVLGIPDWQALVSQPSMDLPPYSVAGGTVEWFLDAGAAAPTATLSNLAHTQTDDQWTAHIDLLGLAQGNALIGNKSELELALVKQPETRLRLEVDAATSLADLEVRFADLAIAQLEGVLFSSLPPELADVTAKGDFRFAIAYGLNPKTPSGSFKIELKNLNFPVPRELAGLVYAPSALVEGKFKADRSFSKFNVAPLTFRTGQLQMKGHSDVEVAGLNAHITSQLSGPLSCSSIVASAAQVHLNTEVARVAANIARRALNGSVEIFVLLDAETQNLRAAKVVKGVGVGCGINRLPLPDLMSFPLPALQRLPSLRDLPELAGVLGRAAQLPKVGSEELKLPSLSDLPTLKLPRLLPLAPESDDHLNE
jgi:hypothetical protein